MDDYALVILAYKSLENIKNRIKEATSGNYLPKEIIIIINYYNEISWAILDYVRTEPKVTRFIFSSQNMGFAKGMNLGFKISSASNVIFLNDDCSCDNETFKSMVDAIKNENDGISCVEFGGREDDIIPMPKGYLLCVKRKAIQESGNYVYDEDASPLGCEIELTYRLDYHGFKLKKSKYFNVNHKFNISANPTDEINYLGITMSPLGINPFQHHTQRLVDDKKDFYKNKIAERLGLK